MSVDHEAVGDAVLDAEDVDAQSPPVYGLENVQFGAFDVERKVVDATDADGGEDGVQRVTVDRYRRLNEALRIDVFDEFSMDFFELVDESAYHARSLKQQPARSATRTKTGVQHERVAVMSQQLAMVVGIRLDEQSRPVAHEFEEYRVREFYAVGGAAFDEETVATLAEQVVDERRLAFLRAGHLARLEFNDDALVGRLPRDLAANVGAQHRFFGGGRFAIGVAVAADYLSVDADRLAEEHEPEVGVRVDLSD